MNIFRLDNEPARAAWYHCDKHVVKMFMESVQLLSTAIGGGEGLCKPTHVNHPCAVWVRQSTANYDWLWHLAYSLGIEYISRYHRVHAYNDMLCDARLVSPACRFATRGATPAPQCMPDKYRGNDAVQAYRRYYLGDKMRFAKWRHSETPDWVLQACPTLASA